MTRAHPEHRARPHRVGGGKGDAERYASSAVRERKELSYKKWAKRLTKYYSLIEKYFSPR